MSKEWREFNLYKRNGELICLSAVPKNLPNRTTIHVIEYGAYQEIKDNFISKTEYEQQEIQIRELEQKLAKAVEALRHIKNTRSENEEHNYLAQHYRITAEETLKELEEL